MIAEWNKKVNLISRKNIDKLWENHILPSAALAGLLLEKAGEGRGDDDETESEIPTCVSECLDGAEFIDVGTGGGFPGIPLAICFPRARFVLVDSVGKKIDVVKDVVNRLGLENVETVQTRAEGLEGKFDFVVGRSVSSLSDFCEWTFKNMRLPSDYRQGEGDGGDADEGPGGRLKTGFLREENLRWQRWGSVRPGLLYINGGDHREQTDGLGVPPEGIFPLSDTLPNVYLGDKYVLHYTAKQLWLSPKCRKRRSEARKREWLLEEKRKRKGESSLQLNRKSISARLDRAHAARRREAFTTQWRW
uniref:Ribosomal RNA small subunit methyltransferase G n=1 Tax=Chromera velia CCMP2878 TaxID=1169474 RepID=A0A0G4F0J6_9ALVE|eukprot:Cvel_14492.t1-p1 / transcript=Cvel_14492.t1 / gene=Cvel_14492 / organism=Chromera_velia_CCMP2878 / gene_product=Ribosomal RNA small subunit methyltransferase G, putative / transcript_product=Ribosomal RNA small subunit methyltransferase G, putative / location=Cvel_scaffold1033:32632-34769(+) / protein_length=304 / sequence_SO=supercontig / SO=protein_coding / is_pseudo=false